MPEQHEVKAIERSCRLFERLLVIYPRAHREEYGSAILQLFRDQCRDAWTAGQSRGLIGFWLHAFADLLKTSILEHLSNLNRSKSMLKYFRPQFRPFSVFFPIFGSAFLFVLFTCVVVTFLLPETFMSEVECLIKRTTTPSSYDEIVQTEFAIIRSHTVLSKVSEAMDLPDVWGKKYNAGQPLTEPEVEALLLNRLEFKPVLHSDVFKIDVYSDSPEEAARIANKVVQTYLQVRAEQAIQNAGTSFAPRGRDIDILNSATPYSVPIRPNKPLNIILGAMMGILAGLIAGTIGAGLIGAVKRNRNVPPVLNT